MITPTNEMYHIEVGVVKIYEIAAVILSLDDEYSYNLSDLSSLASFGEVSFKPQLLVNLHYQDMTGRLTVEVISGANFKKDYMVINPDSFVKIKCIFGTGKKKKSKTTVRRQATDPEFNESFVYPLSVVDLKEATMMFQVFTVGKRRKNKRTLLGWFAFGQNTSGSVETSHWREMIENPDCDVCHWHELQTA